MARARELGPNDSAANNGNHRHGREAETERTENTKGIADLPMIHSSGMASAMLT